MAKPRLPQSPPTAKKAPRASTVLGDTRTDDYAWLRDLKDPDTLTYLKAENRYTDAWMAPTANLQETLYEEMLGRIKQTDQTAPVKDGPYLYYSRTEEGQQYEIHCRRRWSARGEGQDEILPEEIILDENVLAEGQNYFRIGNFETSPDHTLLAYSVDCEGDEDYTIYVKNLTTGELLADEIPNTYYSLEWAADNRTFFYTILDEAKRPYKILRHRLGEPKDTLVYHEPDERYTVEVEQTLSRAFILINIASSLTSEIRCIDATKPDGEFRTLLPRVEEVEYEVTHHAGRNSFFIRTNDNAPAFRVVEAPVDDPSRANWTEFLPRRDDPKDPYRTVMVESVEAFRDHLVIEETLGGQNQIRIHHLESGEDYYISFEEPVYSAGIGGNAEYNTGVVRFIYDSLITPPSVFDYDMRTRNRTLVKQAEVPGYDPSQYASERVYATAEDGVKVPVSLFYRKDLVRDGTAPALLYGYGSYGITIEPAFRSDRFSLINRGFVYAIAHLRGGGYLGKPWHEAGRMLTKKNTFNDFIAAAEHLIAQRYTSPDRLAIMGGSAGGLLMGAVLNLRPDLFAAVLAMVPFVDSLNTMLDPSLPLTVGEWEEWGNPAEEKYYGYMKSYAPYENIVAQDYPHMLVTAGLHDPRVSYWEPAKWVAKLRAMKTDDHMLLMKTHMGSGHFGASGRYEHLRETAFNYAFLLTVLGRA